MVQRGMFIELLKIYFSIVWIWIKPVLLWEKFMKVSGVHINRLIK